MNDQSVSAPTPIAQAVINPFGVSACFISCATPDACNWLKDNAGQYGTLFDPDSWTTHYTLFISSVYDPLDIMNYIAQEIGGVIRE